MLIALSGGVANFFYLFTQVPGMGIAVLFGGGEGDRYAVLHAVALAKRTGEVVHCIRQGPSLSHSSHDSDPSSGSVGQTLLLQLADSAAVTVRCHALEGKDLKDLIALLREQHIFYLILGAGDEVEGSRAEKRLKALRRNIASDRLWSVRSFWSVIARPWSEEAMSAALDDHPDALREVCSEQKGKGQVTSSMIPAGVQYATTAGFRFKTCRNGKCK